MKNGVLRNFAKFTAKHLRHGFFFNKVEHLFYRTPPDDCSGNVHAILLRVKPDGAVLLIEYLKKLDILAENKNLKREAISTIICSVTRSNTYYI